MKSIHKYTLTEAVNEVVTHDGAVFLAAANQLERITVWAEVETSRPSTARTLHVVGTGGLAPSIADYIGTALVAGGEFVFHVYAEPFGRQVVDQ